MKRFIGSSIKQMMELTISKLHATFSHSLGWVSPLRLCAPPAALWKADQIAGESLTTTYAKA